MRLTLDSEQLGSVQTARRVGRTFSYTWSTMDTGTDTKVCVKFTGISQVACDDQVHRQPGLVVGQGPDLRNRRVVAERFNEPLCVSELTTSRALNQKECAW
ncbi:hypothetical protein [Streptomyces griseus]|uniref:hypothetical protein n=1 Tax=Streptomyces griseus TaxID=1911 RepID=UPI0005656127|nr:hypothetical protein [Streptomyces griseus]